MSDETPEVKSEVEPTPEREIVAPVEVPPVVGKIDSFSSSVGPGYSVMFNYICGCGERHFIQRTELFQYANPEVIFARCPKTQEDVKVQLTLPNLPYDIARDANRLLAQTGKLPSILIHTTVRAKE